MVVICKGLLVKRNGKITIFKLQANVNKANLCGMVVIQYQNLQSSENSSLGYLCATLKQLWCDEDTVQLLFYAMLV